MGEVRMVTASPEETFAAGESVGRSLSGGELILLDGPLGAGKTTFVQGLARGLGVEDLVQSPSFVLERIHTGRLTLRHLDYYRLAGDEIEDSGLLPDKDDTKTVTAIEWATRAWGLLQPDLIVTISFVAGAPNKRCIVLKRGERSVKETPFHG